MLPNQKRQHYRQLRRAISTGQQQQHALRLCTNINTALRFLRPCRIAAYLATQGEISLSPWLNQPSLHQLYLPMLYETTAPRLRFAPINADTRWHFNRFNIREPRANWGQTLDARELDIILMPLVAFDRSGRRLGMGGGYYDRSLAFRNWRKHWTHPKLIGIAHGCQESEPLPHNPWDIGLDMVITEKEIITVRR